MEKLMLFQEELGKRLEKMLGTEARITFESMVHNNKSRKPAVIISRSGCDYAVNFNLENIYDYYCENPLSLDSMVSAMILDLENSDRIKWTEEKIRDYELVKGKILMKLVNAGANREILALTPHIPYLDLAVTFYLEIGSLQDSVMNLRINEDVLATWGKDVAEVYAEALRNMGKESVSPQHMRDVMKKILSDMMGDCRNEEADLLNALLFETIAEEKDEDMLYLLTNQNNMLGACRMLDTGVLKNLAESLEKNLYLIPSSIHEILILPEQGKMGPEEIENMVREVNQTEVELEDRLSNAVYLFDRNTLSTRIVREGEPL